METHQNRILSWLNEFKYNWLPKNISSSTQLFQSITKELEQLEQLLIQNNCEEIEISHEEPNQSTTTRETEENLVSTEQPSEHVLPTPSNVHNQIDGETDNFHRPTIRLKRISSTDAERFMPSTWKTTQSKRKRKKKKSLFTCNRRKAKKNTSIDKVLLSTTSDENIFKATNNSNITPKILRSKKLIEHPSTSSFASNQSINDGKKKGKRKLRAIDAEDDDLYTLGHLSKANNLNDNIDCERIPRYIGQNGILSQTRKINETITKIIEDDFIINFESNQSNTEQVLNTNLSEYSNDISSNLNTTKSSTVHTLTIVEDDTPTNVKQQRLPNVIDTNDNESLFASLNITHDNTFETISSSVNQPYINYDDGIEDISNDGVDPSHSPSSNPTTHISLKT